MVSLGPGRRAPSLDNPSAQVLKPLLRCSVRYESIVALLTKRSTFIF